ncbi:MAG: hypothetical protein ABJP34_01690 [Erythrobacter sp.]
MTNIANQALAAVAAIFLTVSSIGAIVTVPPANAAQSSADQVTELA